MPDQTSDPVRPWHVPGRSADDRPDDPGRRRLLGSCAGFVAVALAAGARRTDAAPWRDDLQPLMAQVRRLIEAMAHLGEPFGSAELRAFQGPAMGRGWC